MAPNLPWDQPSPTPWGGLHQPNSQPDERLFIAMANIHLLQNECRDLKTEVAEVLDRVAKLERLKTWILEATKYLYAIILFALMFLGKVDWGTVQKFLPGAP